MKLNWGSGIFIFYTLFVLFILALVFRSSQENVDLVTEDYYQKELEFQDVIRKKANAQKLDSGLVYSLDRNKISFSFPPGHRNASGTILIYRPSNKNFDKRFDIQLDQENRMEISMSSSPAGLYKMKVDWESDSTEFYIEEDIYLKP